MKLKSEEKDEGIKPGKKGEDEEGFLGDDGDKEGERGAERY